MPKIKAETQFYFGLWQRHIILACLAVDILFRMGSTQRLSGNSSKQLKQYSVVVWWLYCLCEQPFALCLNVWVCMCVQWTPYYVRPVLRASANKQGHVFMLHTQRPFLPKNSNMKLYLCIYAICFRGIDAECVLWGWHASVCAFRTVLEDPTVSINKISTTESKSKIPHCWTSSWWQLRSLYKKHILLLISVVLVFASSSFQDCIISCRVT